MGLVSELRRRNVFRVAIAYVIIAWLILQVGDILAPILRLDEWVNSALAFFLILGFPIALVFAWAFEITPGGLKKEREVDRTESVTHITGRKLDYLIIAVLAVALGFFAFDKFVLDPSRDAELVQAATEAVTEQVAEAGNAESPDKSIAVLAFADLSPDGDQEYFSDGISEELLNRLATIPELRVISRTSAFSFKGTDTAIPTVAEQLNVAHVLEGSVRRVGNRVRITAQLIEARSDSHVWSGSYDRELNDIFALQEEIAVAISDALEEKLGLATVKAVHLSNIKVTNIDAYDAYLQGRGVLTRGSGSKYLEEAIRHFERALRLDNNFAPAHAELAIAITLMQDTPGSEGTLSRAEVLRRAVPHLDRAEELEPDLAEAHAGRALLALDTADKQSAIDHARKALALNPSYSRAMNYWWIALSDLGRYQEAGEMLKKMLVTDPLNHLALSNYSDWLRTEGRYEEAQELAYRLIALGDFGEGYHRHAGIALYRGKIAEAMSWTLQAKVQLPHAYYSLGHAVKAFTWIGEYNEARRIDDRLKFIPDIAEGRFGGAILDTKRKMRQDPENEATIYRAAVVLYHAGRFDEALALYERLRDFHPVDRPIYRDTVAMMQLALLRRTAGDEDGAQTAAEIAGKDQAAWRAAIGYGSWYGYPKEAMLAAFEGDPDSAINALDTAIRRGFRDPQFFSDPIFEELWGEPRFVALQQELDAMLATEHDKVLQLICFNNPVPDNWQPLPETCEGAEQQPVL